MDRRNRMQDNMGMMGRRTGMQVPYNDIGGSMMDRGGMSLSGSRLGYGGGYLMPRNGPYESNRYYQPGYGGGLGVYRRDRR